MSKQETSVGAMVTNAIASNTMPSLPFYSQSTASPETQGQPCTPSPTTHPYTPIPNAKVVDQQ